MIWFEIVCYAKAHKTSAIMINAMSTPSRFVKYVFAEFRKCAMKIRRFSKNRKLTS